MLRRNIKNLEIEKVQLISTINLQSQKLIKLSHLKDKQIDELLHFHETLKKIQGFDMNDDNLKCFEDINHLLNELINRNHALYLTPYLERIMKMIEQKFILKTVKPYETDEILNKKLNTEIELLDAYVHAKEVQGKMKEIKEQLENNGEEDLDYSLLDTQILKYKFELVKLMNTINSKKELVEANGNILVLVGQEEDERKFEEYLEMNFDDFIERGQKLQVKKAEKSFNMNRMREMGALIGGPSFNSLASYNPNEQQKSVNNDLAEIKGQIVELAKGQQELIQKINTVTQELEENYLLTHTGGDIRKEINAYLKMKPINLQAASLKIRSFIENWVRYKFGINLSNNVLFSNDSVADKMRTAGVPEEYINDLVTFYKATNPYIHNNIEQISEISDQDRAIEIIRAVDYLTQEPFTNIDEKAGIAMLYKIEDQLVKAYMDEHVEELKDETSTLNTNLMYWIKNQLKRKTFMEEKNIDYPQVNFHSKQDIIRYKNSLIGENFETEFIYENAGLPEIGTRLRGVIKEFGKGENYLMGWIVSDNYEFSFHIKETRGNLDKKFIKPGLEVEFTLGKYYEDYQAKDIVLLS
jgi:hypothetical protein